jgi:calcineurin-like phosphoesterase family protein
MNAAMVDRWNDVVADSDEVWMLGDLVMNQLAVNLAAYVSRLKGLKILVPGNHDACWHGHRKGARQVATYLEVGGVARIVDAPSPIVIASHPVRICHFPYRIDTHHDLRYIEHRPDDDGAWLLHGHVHEKWRQNDRQINVGVDAWDFAPVNDDTISELIQAGPAHIDCPDYAMAV